MKSARVDHVDLGRFALNDRFQMVFSYALTDGRSGNAVGSFDGESEGDDRRAKRRDRGKFFELEATFGSLFQTWRLGFAGGHSRVLGRITSRDVDQGVN